jgi:hypothetical protein
MCVQAMGAALAMALAMKEHLTELTRLFHAGRFREIDKPPVSATYKAKACRSCPKGRV